MSIDHEIRKAFERHEADVQTQPGAWQELERHIGRSHRRRLAATALGAALAIAGAVAVIPRIGERQVIPPAVSGWNEFRPVKSGLRFLYPNGWTASEVGPLGSVQIVPPGRPLAANGKIGFQILTTLESGRFDDPSKLGILAGRTSAGTIHGRRFLRAEQRFVLSGPDQRARSVTYWIDWPTTVACPLPASSGCFRTLVATIDASTENLWTRYGATAEQIVRTMTFSTPPAHAPSSQPRLVGKVPVSATALAANDTSLWAISASFTAGKPGTLTRIDPRTRRVLARINVGDSPQAVAADAGGVWVTNPFQGTTSGGSANYPHNNSIMRIDPATNRVVATISSEHPEDVALGFGAVWVTSRDGTALETTLLRIDPATNRVVTKIPLAKASDDSRVTVGESYAWVSVPVSAPNGTISQIYRIDPTSNQATKVASIEGVGGGQIASGEGAVWVTAPMQTSASGLVRLDPTTGSVIARITLPDAAPVGLTAVTTGNGFVWATSARGSFWKVDPASDHPIGDPQLIGAVPPEGAPDVLSAFGSVWVASDDGRIWQFTP